MALCVNQSGTWREITTQCVKQSSTWREVVTGCINQSGTWREFGFGDPLLGTSCGGGFIICRASSINWIVSPYSAEVTRTWYCRNDASTRALQVTGCTGWFVPNINQLQDPGYKCRTYWDSFSSTYNFSSTENDSINACHVRFGYGIPGILRKSLSFCVRAFRCVSY